MSYDVLLELGSPTRAARVEEAVLALPGVRKNGKALCWCHDTFGPDGQRFFTIEVSAKNWLGRVKALAFNLPFGGDPEEARLFAGAVQRLVVALEGRAFDPQVGGALPIAAEAEAILAKWLEANLWSLGNYRDQGFLVRPPAIVAEDGRTLLLEAVRGRSVDPEEARRSVELAFRRLAPLAGAARAGARAGRPPAPAGPPVPGKAEALVAQLVALVEGGGAQVDDDDDGLDLDHDEPTEDELVDALVALGPAAAPALVRALDGPAEMEVSDALKRLGPAAVPALLEALVDPERRFSAGDVLRELGPAARPALVAALETVPDAALEPLVDVLADDALEADTATAEAAVTRFLRTPSDAVEVGAVLASAGRRGHDVRPALERLLREAEPFHAAEAAHAFAGAGVQAAVEPYVEYVLAREDALEQEIAAALGQLGPFAARLEAALDRAGAWQQRARLLGALAEADGARALPRLLALLRRPTSEAAWQADEEAQAARWTFGHLRRTDVLPELLALCDDPLPRVRSAVAGALGWRDPPEARAAAERLAREDPDPEVRREAAEALTARERARAELAAMEAADGDGEDA